MLGNDGCGIGMQKFDRFAINCNIGIASGLPETTRQADRLSKGRAQPVSLLINGGEKNEEP
jgi:hypothetical protein